MSKRSKQKLTNEGAVPAEGAAQDSVKVKKTFFQKLSSPEWAVARKWIHVLFTILPIISIFINIYAPICEVHVIKSFYVLRASDTMKYIKDAKFGGYAYLPAAFFIAFIICIVAISTLLIVSLVNFHNERKMERIAKVNMILGTASAVIFSGIGIFTPAVIHTVRGNPAKVNTSFTAVTFMVVIVIVYSVFLGMVSLGRHQNEENEYELSASERRSKLRFRLLGSKIELAIYTIAISAAAIVALLSNIVIITIESESVTISNHSMSGINLLANPQMLPTVGERMLAFFVFAFLLLCGTFAIMSIVSLVSRSVLFPKVSVSTSIVCTSSSLLIGLFGTYYRIVQNMNVETIKNIVSQYTDRTEEIVEELVQYKVQSPAIWWFVVCAGILGIMFVRRPYSRIAELETQLAAEEAAMLPRSVDISSINDDITTENGEGADAENADAENEEQTETLPSPKPDFDPCPVFTEIDSEVAALKESRAALVDAFTLPNLVEFIVQYARNSKNHLFYTRESIAAFLAGLGTTRLTILQGMSGTGKTSLPKIVSEALGSVCDIVEVESSWRDKNELLGYYNEFSKMYTPKKFTRALYRARLCPDRLTFIVLDEMNLSRIEYYFSDFLSLMEHEPDQRELRLVNISISRTENGENIPYAGLSGGHTLKIPENVWFIGTANRDESTYDISDKVYDRAHTMNFDKRAAKEPYYSEELPARYMSASELTRLFDEAKANVNFDLEQYPVIGEVEKLLEPYNISFGNRIAMQMESFVKIYASCFAVSESVIKDGLETILLSKVVRKLELKRIDDKDALAAEFDKLHLTKCSEFIRGIKED